MIAEVIRTQGLDVWKKNAIACVVIASLASFGSDSSLQEWTEGKLGAILSESEG